MYDPSIGRWLEEDPIGFEGGDANLSRYVGNDPVNATDPTGLLECDDRENAPGNRRLVNVDEKLENYVNQVIREQTARVRREGGTGQDLARYVYEALGRNRYGSGVDVWFGLSQLNVAPISEIEHWLRTNLSSASNEINQVLFLQSRYRFNRTGRWSGPWWFMSSNINVLNHGIAPAIRIDGTLMGTDKWGHFFQQGYWLYFIHEAGQITSHRGRFALCAAWEGAYNESNRGIRQNWSRFFNFGSSPGSQGAGGSGVISRADIYANLAGFDFYANLASSYDRREGAPIFRFRISQYQTRRFNESVVTPNIYVDGVSVDDSSLPGPNRPVR